MSTKQSKRARFYHRQREARSWKGWAFIAPDPAVGSLAALMGKAEQMIQEAIGLPAGELLRGELGLYRTVS